MAPFERDRADGTPGGRRVEGATFLIAANGPYEGPPFGPLRDYLLMCGASRVTTVLHPLDTEGGQDHEITVYEPPRARRRRVRLPSRPPLTYPLDALVPPWPPPVDGWFGLNNLACARGLAARGLGRAGRVIYWAIDFVPERFGDGSLTRSYDRLDALCCRQADARFELSDAALEGRSRRHGLSPVERASARVVPLGAWIDSVPKTAADGWRERRIVFVGSLVERQGVATLIEALALLADREVQFAADIVGQGPLEAELRSSAARLGLEDRVSFHGFVADDRLEAILAAASVAVAPYDTDSSSFTRFADPGKLKAYLAAGLPIVTTDVPPNADELATKGGAEITRFEPPSLAESLERSLASEVEWTRRRAAALELARQFDWRTVLRGALTAAGFDPEARPSRDARG